MATSPIRVLVVDDHEPFQRFVASIIQQHPELQIVDNVNDGLAAVQKAQELQPELVVLDIGLPTLNGIEAARRIRKLSPNSKILFLSQESSIDLIKEALSLGASGYVVKTDAGSELLMAVNAVLRGETFVSRTLAGYDFTGTSDARAPECIPLGRVLSLPRQQNKRIARRHEALFYSDDASFLDELTQFIGAALNAGNAAIVVASKSHRESLLLRLQVKGVNIGAAIEQGTYISLDAADTLSMVMLNGMLDPARFLNLLGNLIVASAETVKGEQARVAIFGECVQLLWAQGNVEAAIQFERLGNQLAKTYEIDILCGYSLASVQGRMDDRIFQRICAEHSATFSR